MIHIFRSEASKHSSLKMNPCLAHHRTSYLLISCKYYIDVGAECCRRTLVTKNYVAAVKVKNKCPSKVMEKSQEKKFGDSNTVYSESQKFTSNHLFYCRE